MPKTTCDNPMCSCDPCTCDTCTCGVARVGELERRVMMILWERGDDELTGRQVADALPEHAYTTVATVLDRLVHKGLVRRRKLGRSIRFAAVGTQGPTPRSSCTRPCPTAGTPTRHWSTLPRSSRPRRPLCCVEPSMSSVTSRSRAIGHLRHQDEHEGHADAHHHVADVHQPRGGHDLLQRRDRSGRLIGEIGP
jgi:hypothetical protein